MENKFLGETKSCVENCGECCFPGYEALCDIFTQAIYRAAVGKGRERHSKPGLVFEEQMICSEIREEGHGAARFQAKKKITEAKRLPRNEAVLELLDAMVYLAADVIVLQEEIMGEEKSIHEEDEW